MAAPSYGADGTITYNFVEITDVATAIGSFEGAMDGALEDLFNQLHGLFAANWTGAAGQACRDAHDKWRSGADEIKLALGQVADKLGLSAERIQQLDKQIAAGM